MSAQMEPTRLLAILTLTGLLGVEYGGWALLTFISGRAGLSEAQLRWFRAGHAHAGTLLVLSLVYFRYLSDTSLSMTLRWTGGALNAGGHPRPVRRLLCAHGIRRPDGELRRDPRNPQRRFAARQRPDAIDHRAGYRVTP
jgi:hypothetical protein